MAGCKPEYMPVLVAAFEGLTDPAFRMNHMASLGSPWPLVIVNGPIVERLGMNTGQYLLGPTGNRANATIGRAVSLTMANCFDAKVGGVQRGTMGNPNRWSFCAAEREGSPWPRVHEQRGLAGGVSAVTVVGTMDGVLQFVTPNFTDPTDLCELIAQRIAHGFFTLGTFVVMMAPVFQQHFIDAGWTQDDVKTYLTEHTCRSVASLKTDGRWERYGTRLSPTAPPIEPGDDTRLSSHAPRPRAHRYPVHPGRIRPHTRFPHHGLRGRGGELRGLRGPLPPGHRAGHRSHQGLARQEGAEPRWRSTFPSPRPDARGPKLAPRLDTFDGKRVGILWESPRPRRPPA